MTTNMIKEFQDLAELHFDPVRDITEFVRNCRNNGMDQNQVIDTMMDHYGYSATEAEIVVHEFWKQTA